MEKTKTLSRKRNLGHAVQVRRGPNDAYIPHVVVAKSQEPVQEQKVELHEDESNVVPPPTWRKRTWTPTEISAHFRTITPREPTFVVPAPYPIEPAPASPAASVEDKSKNVCKPRKRFAQQKTRRRKDPSKPIIPRLPVRVIRACNTTGNTVQSAPPTPKPKEPEVIPESSAESVSEDSGGTSQTSIGPKSVPESSAESVSEDVTSQTPVEPKSTPELIQQSEAESIDNSPEKKGTESDGESVSDDEVFFPNPATEIPPEPTAAVLTANSPPSASSIQATFLINGHEIRRAWINSIPNEQNKRAFDKLAPSVQQQLKSVLVGRFYEHFEDYVAKNDELKGLYGFGDRPWSCSICPHIGIGKGKLRNGGFGSFSSKASFSRHWNNYHLRPAVCIICGDDFPNAGYLEGHLRQMKVRPTRPHLFHQQNTDE